MQMNHLRVHLHPHAHMCGCAVWRESRQRRGLSFKIPDHNNIILPAAAITTNCEKEYLMFALGEGNCNPGSSRLYRLGVSQAQSRSRKISTRGYALHSVCPKFSFSLLVRVVVHNMLARWKPSAFVSTVLNAPSAMQIPPLVTVFNSELFTSSDIPLITCHSRLFRRV